MVAGGRTSRARKLWRRFLASEAELEATDLQQRREDAGCGAVRDARPGQLCAVAGRLRTVVYTPRIGVPTLEADLYDGSETVTLVWLGRRHIPGIEPGRQLTAKGRIALRDDRKVIYNPYYEFALTE